MATTISIQTIEVELQELAGPNLKVKVTADATIKTTSSAYFTDKQFIVKLNPERITKRSILDKQVETMRIFMGGAV